jgi:D-beta-D-heptose 7-phosphate kinase/D-beta-D-heptose 1-phosphate adenosyltransferase
MIYKNVHEAKAAFDRAYQFRGLVATSGGFDPLHIGHVRCILESSDIALVENLALIVIVNSDEFLMRKKGKVFMPLHERMEIIDSIKGVHGVVPWEDGSQFVSGALEILQPLIFAKGGDRSDPDKVPEFSVCQSIGCEIRFGVGGREKVQSSSNLTK